MLCISRIWRPGVKICRYQRLSSWHSDSWCTTSCRNREFSGICLQGQLVIPTWSWNRCQRLPLFWIRGQPKVPSWCIFSRSLWGELSFCRSLDLTLLQTWQRGGCLWWTVVLCLAFWSFKRRSYGYTYRKYWMPRTRSRSCSFWSCEGLRSSPSHKCGRTLRLTDPELPRSSFQF